MNFSTKVTLAQSELKVDYQSEVVLLGSCFAQNMAAQLDYYKLPNYCNPFGILFHPVAIERLLFMAVSGKVFDDADVFFYNERWHCFETHSSLSNANKDELIGNLNAICKAFKQKLQTASHIIITYGTAWVYEFLETKSLVANCHKLPQGQFEKKILSVDAVAKAIENSVAMIDKINAKAQLVVTISPVRHIKDGFFKNQVSKSHLFSGLYRAMEQSNEVFYFPAYEIMMDELRDYRFYADDMLHPSRLAIAYIWECFCRCFVSEETKKVMHAVDAVQKGLAHLPFDAASQGHQKFRNNLQFKIKQLQELHPAIQF